jgi:glutamate/tyrosine decarboxylase-like PLP-dependent enzyme
MDQQLMSDFAHPVSAFDPADWSDYRASAHRMVDDLVDQLAGLRDQPLWRPMPDEVRTTFRDPAPPKVQGLDQVYADYLQLVAPYGGGNRHPGFMGWVQGSGAPVGVLAELLAAGMNMNCGGRDHVGIALEQQVALWVRGWFGFPETSQGLFCTGASGANFVACLAARTRALGETARSTGVGGGRLTAYTSTGAHACVVRALEMAGLGREHLRLIDVGADYAMDLDSLKAAIAGDRAEGFVPFLVVGTAGTVDVGAFDDLNALADIAAAEGLWLHVDGAFGAMGVHNARIRPRLAGLERADSVAFDFHKWGQVPYDAGFIIVRNGDDLKATFSSPANYLCRETRGLAAGDFWPTDYGPDLSRGCRALKTWFVLRVNGTEAIGAAIDRGLDLAAALADRVEPAPDLELMAPVGANIVCFRYRPAREGDLDRLNGQIAAELQLEGRVAPSLTRIGGKVVLRAALFNPRSDESDIEALIEGVRRIGAQLAESGRP